MKQQDSLCRLDVHQSKVVARVRHESDARPVAARRAGRIDADAMTEGCAWEEHSSRCFTARARAADHETWDASYFREGGR
jgi:hypothetical protein